ncbi:hypothetical protein HHK36_026138 [Tetracentron sinense]|uniref:Uncharacterized protein n=1 Tax=Tetracentron sinense TaxID=13715 RepID=A0A835D3T9_TETSI|nr:hypothetical protein HHK36_026138 [Tetracentron sinense]
MCTFDHRIVDAYSANIFSIAWVEIAQEKNISPPPSFQCSLLNPRRPGCYDSSHDNMYVPLSSLLPPTDPKLGADYIISHIYYVTTEDIHRLQSLASSNDHKRSKFEAFSAFLWQIVAKGTSENAKGCKMGIVVDGMTRLSGGEGDKSSSMANYFGNVLSVPFDQPVLPMIYGKRKEVGAAFVVSLGQRFPVQKVDFGWGRPAFRSYNFTWDDEVGYVILMPSATEDGDWVMYMHLFKGHLEMLETEAADVFRPFTPDYLNLA